MTEQFSNFARTTLAGGISAGATSLTVVDASFFPPSAPFRIAIDKEIFLVTGLSGNTFTVTPGYEGSTQSVHSSGVVVWHGPTAGLLTGIAAASSPTAGRSTAGNATLQLSDFLTSLVSADNSPVSYLLPTGLPQGFKCRSYQGGSGQITYVAATGASVLNGALRSFGPYTSGYFVDIENMGGDQWVVLGNTTTGVQSWAIAGMPSVREGDACTFIIYWPDAVNSSANGGSIQINGSGFGSAGTDYNLIQAIQNFCSLNPAVTFDGVNTLTVKTGALNPIAINFYATPQYTNLGNRNISITLSSPSVGNIAAGGSSATTTILNTSKPLSPSALFPPVTVSTVGSAAASQNNITVTNGAALSTLMTVTGSASIPALTYITAINGNVLTLSANLTGIVADNTSLTFTPAGLWLDCSATGSMTIGSGNKVSTITDLANGYQLTQATSGKQPVFTANSQNGLGALTFSGGQLLTIGMPGQVTQTVAITVPPSANTITLGSAAGLSNGMIVSGPGAPAGAAITAINGNIITISLSISPFGQINSGTLLYFTPANEIHPIVSLPNYLAAQKLTIILAAKLTTPTVNSTYLAWDKFHLQCSTTLGLEVGDTGTYCSDIPGSVAAGNPYIWTYLNDGFFSQILYSGQRFAISVTLTADFVQGTKTCTVDDATGVGGNMVGMAPVPGLSAGNNIQVSSTTSNTITFNQNASATIPAGTQLLLVQPPGGVGGHVHAAAANTVLGMGFDPLVGGFALTGVIYEVIVVPRILSTQEWRGVNCYLAQKWGTTNTQTTGAAASAGATQITMSSTTGVYPASIISGTGLASNTLVTRVNPNTNIITIDTPVQTGGISNGATLSFATASFKHPKFLDASQFQPTFRDDFSAGLSLWNGTSGWIPYYGNPSSPGNFNSAYSAAGHGSSNNLGLEREFYLDILNWSPWLKYNPFSNPSPVGAETGELMITATPAPPAIANLIGYTLPDSRFTYTSGYISSNPWFYQQYGYFEARLKLPPQLGAWPAFWMQCADGNWPPEIDIIEGYAQYPGTVSCTTHGNNSFVVPSSDHSQADYGDVVLDTTLEYALYGVEVTPTAVTFYVNREAIASYPITWDQHCMWYMQLNLAVASVGGIPDNVTPMNMHVDYVGAWKRIPQNPTVPTATQAETTALLAAMNIQPTTQRQNLINQLIASLKTYQTSFGVSLWSSLDFLFLVAAHDSQAARINWKNPAQIGTLVGSPTFITDRGYTGVLNTSYIDTGINFFSVNPQLTFGMNHVGGVMNNAPSANGNVVGTPSYAMQINTGTEGVNNMHGASGLINYTISGSPSSSRCVSSRNQYHNVAYRNGAHIALHALVSNASVSQFDNTDLLIANGSGQVACAHGGIYWTPDDVLAFDGLIFNFLHAIGAQ